MSYPLFLNIRDFPCLVVGGGRVGLRKTQGLLEAGAKVTVVDPVPLEALAGLEERLILKRREFRMEDLAGMRLVFAATGQMSVNAKVAQGAREQQIFCNVADDPSLSDFFLPALARRGDLMLAISTGGRSPAFSRKLRMDLEASLDDTYVPFLDLMGRIREVLLQREHAPDIHREIFRELVDGPLLEALRKGGKAAVISVLLPFMGEMDAVRILSDAPDLFRKKGKTCR